MNFIKGGWSCDQITDSFTAQLGYTVLQSNDMKPFPVNGWVARYHHTQVVTKFIVLALSKDTKGYLTISPCVYPTSSVARLHLSFFDVDWNMVGVGSFDKAPELTEYKWTQDASLQFVRAFFIETLSLVARMHLVCYYPYHSCLCTFWSCHPYLLLQIFGYTCIISEPQVWNYKVIQGNKIILLHYFLLFQINHVHRAFLYHDLLCELLIIIKCICFHSMKSLKLIWSMTVALGTMWAILLANNMWLLPYDCKLVCHGCISLRLANASL